MESLIKGKIKQMYVTLLILVMVAVSGCEKGTVVLQSTSTLDNCGSVAARKTDFANSALGGNGDTIPWQICTTSQFQNIENDLTAKYQIINDLDFSNESTVGFTGTFEGNLDGKGYTLSNVSISGNSLFEKAKGAKITNMTLENWRVDGTSSDVGALFGSVESDDINLFEIDQLTAKNLIVNSPSGQVGGLIGQLGSVTTTPGSYKLTNIDLEGQVTSGGSSAGGLIGSIYKDDGSLTITNSKVKIIMTGTNYTGGLFGSDNNGNTQVSNVQINQILTVTGLYSGGLFGRVLNSQSKLQNISGSVTINHSGSTGSIYIGGIGGYLYGTDSKITDTQLDVTISTAGNFSGGILGYSRGPILTENISVSAKINGRGYLAGITGYHFAGDWLAKNIIVDFDLTATSPYAAGIGGYVRDSDVTVSSATITGLATSTSNNVAGVFGFILNNTLQLANVNVGAIFNSLGSYGAGLIGRIDDTTFSISESTDVKITISNGTSYLAGAFGYTDGSGEILGGNYASDLGSGSYMGGIISRSPYSSTKGITISGVNVETSFTSTGSSAGGLAGELSQFSKISNVTIAANITSTADNIGLGVGTMGENSEVDHIVVTGTISGDMAASDNCGGVAGYARSHVLISNAEINLIASCRDNVAGVVGYLSTGGAVSIVNATVDLQADRTTGGVAGSATASTIFNANIMGTLSNITSEDVAGLVGYLNSNSSINNSSAIVTLSSSGTSRVGGLVGYQRDSTIANSWSAGSLTNTGIYSAGISAFVYSTTGNTFSNVYSTMSITGAGYTGGLLGSIDTDNSTLENCFFTGSINIPSGSGVGGLVGRMLGAENNFIKYCYVDASITSSVGLDGPIYGSGVVSRVDTTSVYYNSSQPDPGFGNYTGTPLTSTQMLVPANFINFDFSTPLWEAPTGSYLLPGSGSYSYPILEWME